MLTAPEDAAIITAATARARHYTGTRQHMLIVEARVVPTPTDPTAVAGVVGDVTDTVLHLAGAARASAVTTWSFDTEAGLRALDMIGQLAAPAGIVFTRGRSPETLTADLTGDPGSALILGRCDAHRDRLDAAWS